jgi:hypothetical protein
MDPKERRRYDNEQKRKAKIEADLEPEKFLKDYMEMTKRHVATVAQGGDLLYERLSGRVTVEDGD